MGPMIQLANVLTASRRIDPTFLDTPLATAPALDAALGCEVLTKVEAANPIGSFSGRGAELFAATALKPAEAVGCASVGNFGQGLAWAASRRGHPCMCMAEPDRYVGRRVATILRGGNISQGLRDLLLQA